MEKMLTCDNRNANLCVQDSLGCFDRITEYIFFFLCGLVPGMKPVSIIKGTRWKSCIFRKMQQINPEPYTSGMFPIELI